MRIQNILLAERGQWALWLPVAFASGIAVYFALPIEPPLRWGLGAAGSLLILRLLSRNDAVRALMLGLMAASLGFTAATLRTETVRAPVLTHKLGPLTLEGTVRHATPAPGAVKLVLIDVAAPDLLPEATPERIRITVRVAGDAAALPKPGDRLSMLAILRPPPPPVMPGAFDFQRHAYFLKIGAYGFSLRAPRRIGHIPAKTFAEAISRRVEALRLSIATRVLARDRGPPGAVAAALLTGLRGAIDATTLQAMRDAGIAHLLAISGLHIGLVAGLVFGGIRLLIAAMPWLGLRLHAKKVAAAAAIPAAFSYAMLAGFTVPTERAFLMTGLFLAGILMDRRTLTLRTVAWAAMVVLALAPESLMSPGFQMSFAAVTALISAYAWLAQRRRLHGPPPKGEGTLALLSSNTVRYVGSVVLTTLIASAATGPFAVHHFQHVAVLGIVANTLAVPLAAFWVMPSGLLSVLAMPFGLEELPLALMFLGLRWILASATWVSGLPGGTADITAPPAWSMLPLVFGGLWLTLWQTRWRLLGVPVFIFGILGPVFAQTPHIIIDGEARVVAIDEPGQGLLVSTRRAGRFEAARWTQRLGYGDVADRWPVDVEVTTGGLRCEAAGCIMRRTGAVIAVSKFTDALLEDCRHADMVIALVPVRTLCRPPWGVIDRFDLWRYGTHTVTFNENGPSILTVNGTRGRRPWVLRPNPQ
tara:strand:+ start:3368 stop:5473 length:2106 start_codon:yes stop_codon:yes gene_type:complete